MKSSEILCGVRFNGHVLFSDVIFGKVRLYSNRCKEVNVTW